MLTNSMVSFAQLGPGLLVLMKSCILIFLLEKCQQLFSAKKLLKGPHIFVKQEGHDGPGSLT